MVTFKPSSRTCRFSSRVPNKVSICGLISMFFFIRSGISLQKERRLRLSCRYDAPSSFSVGLSGKAAWLRKEQVDGGTHGLRKKSTGSRPTSRNHYHYGVEYPPAFRESMGVFHFPVQI